MENKYFSVDRRVVRERLKMQRHDSENYKQVQETLKMLEEMKKIGVLKEPQYNLALSGHISLR